MIRTNRTEVTVGLDRPGIHEAFAADPARWLAPPARRMGDRWVVELHVAKVHRPVAMTLGAAWTSGGATWRRIRWEPMDTPGDVLPHTAGALPVFEGELGLEPGATEGELLLVIEGTYEPPGGIVGKVADAVAMRGAASVSFHHLLSEIASRLHAATSANL